MGKKKTALVLIHLSSLDSFADFFRDEDPKFTGTYALAARLTEAAIKHDGPVVIADQDWAAAGPHSRPRFMFEQALKRSGRKVTRIHFDEDESDWDPFLAKLRKTLERLGVERVILGGVWFDPGEAGGCVTATYQYLKLFFTTTVASDLVGCEDDMAPWHPEVWTYAKAL